MRLTAETIVNSRPGSSRNAMMAIDSSSEASPVTIKCFKDDPLKRIQEEINEVARRERELRDKDLHNGSAASGSAASDISAIDAADNMSGISDDSGISSASSPVNGMSSNVSTHSSAAVPVPFKRSITVSGSVALAAPTTPVVQTPHLAASPASHHLTTVGPTLTRAMSTPQIFTPTPPAKRFAVAGGSQKGMMQRFLASRGKYISTANNAAGNAIGMRAGDRDSILTSIKLNRSPINITPEFSPPIIERDEHGKPIRRGYVPVEEKIQRELRDLKSRESELKRHNRLCKLRRSQPDLLDAVSDSLQYDSGEASDNDDEHNDGSVSDDSAEAELEHCFVPGKLRASKSIGELCLALNAEQLTASSNSSYGNNATGQRQPIGQHNGNGSTASSLSPCPPRSSSAVAGSARPAVSLAELCDVSPDEAPSSHRLIAQWENLIQQRQEVA